MAFDFNASANPSVQYGAYNQTRSPQRPPVQGMDMLALFQLLLQAQQQQGMQRGAQQREVLNPVHRGMGGGVIDQTTGKEVGNPFDNGFFQNSASQLTPEARLASQGPSAMNQWTMWGQPQQSMVPLMKPKPKPKTSGRNFSFGVGAY